jgi:hypothetical protein
MARRPKPSGRKRLPDKGRRPGRRAVNTRPLRPTFLIACEGSKTEPNYFRRFRANISVIELDIRGVGDNTLSLVRQTCEWMQEADYSQVWCVFDRDSFPAEQFNRALELAGQRGIRVAYSNEAFELWYLLHFHYHDVATSRSDYGRLLTKRLGVPYRKNSLGMYDLLLERQSDAIRNAQRLLDFYGREHNPERDNPSTTVHILVQKLNEYIR